MHAGTFSILGISCSHALTQGSHPTGSHTWYRRRGSIPCTLSAWTTITPEVNQATPHREGVGHTCCKNSTERPTIHFQLTMSGSKLLLLRMPDWLNAPPVTAIGLRLTDEAIRVEVGFWLGSTTCQHLDLLRFDYMNDTAGFSVSQSDLDVILNDDLLITKTVHRNFGQIQTA